VTQGLRVWLLADDAERRGHLERDLRAAGHEVTASPDQADVALASGAPGPIGPLPLVMLGGVPDDVASPAGVLPIDAAPDQIDAALRAVAAGLVVRVGPPATTGFQPRDELPSVLLTPREIEILAAIGEGDSNKEAARRLGISAHTVKFHLEAIFRKLGATSRAEAVGKGLRQRLIEI
jgi:two-component system, NarL family, nitrate/nitrite response regulator NarL